MRTATTSGLRDGTSACTALPSWRTQDSAVGDMRPVVLGMASDPADLWLGDCVCAPPLLKRIVGVGGTFEMPRREMLLGSRRARKKAWSADMRIAVSQVARPRARLGREGGPVGPGNELKRSTTSNRRGGRMPRRHINAFEAVWCWSGLMGATRDHSAARLLQSCFRRRCKPASAAVGALRRLMGPTPSRPGSSSISRFV